MILKASQRAGSAQLAQHLLRTDDNDHVTIHELRGFVSDDLHSAFKEAYAISRGTKCQHFLFSLSLSPPPKETVPIEVFEKAIAAIEEKVGLSDQPRAIVFHEKKGRRHAHCVWSRIDASEMKAINLSHFKMKLRDISRELFIENDWQMPRGLMSSEERNPLNFSIAEWQQAKRIGRDPRAIKQVFQDCWAISDSAKAFASALEDHGYVLAKGDRRGFVALDWRGEVYAVSKWVGLRSKQITARLGQLESLPSVNDAQMTMAEKFTGKLKQLLTDAEKQNHKALAAFEIKRQALIAEQRRQRGALDAAHKQRRRAEALERAARLPTGLKAIWFRLTGKYTVLKKKNEKEALFCDSRDQQEHESLVAAHLLERQALQHEKRLLRHRQNVLDKKIFREIGWYRRLSSEGESPNKNQRRKESYLRSMS